MMPPMNAEVAQRLRETALLLEKQGANPFRVNAYRHAADALEQLDRPVSDILEREGIEGLRRLPGIGESLARSIRNLVTLGRLPMLDRLRGGADPLALLASVPGIGNALARRLHDELGIETLEELEMAAHDGRLHDIAGVGPKKLAGIIDSLTSRLGRVRRRSPEPHEAPHEEAPIEELLDVDEEYRRKAASGTLPRLAPHRFNPTGEAWLPVLHTQRKSRHYTALYSNTARAHQLGQTRDWVVLYWDDGAREHQRTVITAQRGPLAGKRVVAGHEAECGEYYEKHGGVRSEEQDTARGTEEVRGTPE